MKLLIAVRFLECFGELNDLASANDIDNSMMMRGQSAIAVRSRRTVVARQITTHSTGLAIRLDFIINVDCSPVNSSVRFLKVRGNIRI